MSLTKRLSSTISATNFSDLEMLFALLLPKSKCPQETFMLQGGTGQRWPGISFLQAPCRRQGLPPKKLPRSDEIRVVWCRQVMISTSLPSSPFPSLPPSVLPYPFYSLYPSLLSFLPSHSPLSWSPFTFFSFPSFTSPHLLLACSANKRKYPSQFLGELQSSCPHHILRKSRCFPQMLSDYQKAIDLQKTLNHLIWMRV